MPREAGNRNHRRSVTLREEKRPRLIIGYAGLRYPWFGSVEVPVGEAQDPK